MLRFVAVVSGDQLETLLLAARACGVTPEIGVELGPSPHPKRRARKQSTKRKAKKYPGRTQVRLAAGSNLSPMTLKAHSALRSEFGGEPFKKSLAKGVIAKALKKSSVNGYVSQLMERGGLVVVRA